jgi:polyferredoxin
MDLLRWRVLATFTKQTWSRTSLQLVLLAVAAAIVLHGLLGPQIAPRNLSTVLTWVHYRGLLIVALLAVGNLFCSACPMIAVRDAGRRLVHPAWRWPRALRSKWPALLLFAAVLYCYELFDLWSLPGATAWLVLGYFIAALVVDLLFAGASFCKYVCPVGQFSFIASMLSPTELRVRDAGTCRACATVDCIRGRHEVPTTTSGIVIPERPAPLGHNRGRLLQRGCELNLFLPLKVGNLDCTLCFDCVRACPHDNIALTLRVPGEELSDMRRRSGLGRLDRRWDLAALAIVFTFGALLNAFAMTSPALRLTRWAGDQFSTGSEAILLLMLFGVGLLVVPALLFGAAAAIATITTPRDAHTPVASSLVWWAYSLVPLGVGTWAAHYTFHLLTGLDIDRCLTRRGLPAATRMRPARRDRQRRRGASPCRPDVPGPHRRCVPALDGRHHPAGDGFSLDPVAADGHAGRWTSGMTRPTPQLLVVALWLATPALAHDGPPFPIVSDREAGPYRVSVWTDPDTTDDGSPGGQFWVMMSIRDSSAALPDRTRATVTATPSQRPGPGRTAIAAPVRGSVSTQFASLVLADEGRFDVRVTIDGPLGAATVDAHVDATYDTRPSPLAVIVYLMPFILIGVLWGRQLLRRRAVAITGRTARRSGPGSGA